MQSLSSIQLSVGILLGTVIRVHDFRVLVGNFKHAVANTSENMIVEL